MNKMPQTIRNAAYLLTMATACSLAIAQTTAAPAARTTTTPTSSDTNSTSASLPQPLPLADHIAALVSAPAVARDHWGIMVTTLDGKPIYALNEAQLFQPASNAKLFTTAAALALLGPKATVETTVVVHGIFTGKEYVKGSVYLIGDGDANLSGRAVPYAPNTDEAFPPLRYLDAMAVEIASTGLKTVDGDVVGIAGHLPDQPYPEGWSVDDLPWGYGAPVSSLSVNDNQLRMTIRPSSEVSSLGEVDITPVVPYYTVINQVLTVEAKSPTQIAVERLPGSKQLRVYGRIAVGANPEVEHISIDDPPEFAAIALKQLLEQHGVTVTGRGIAEHATSDDARSFRQVSHEPLDLAALKNTGRFESGSSICDSPCDPAKVPRSVFLSGHTSPTLLEDVILTNKASLNLHAELLLRRLGYRFGFNDYPFPGTFADGARVVRQFLINAGIDKDDFIFYDGSGLSSHDLVTPRATARLLSYAARDPKTGQPQPWFTAWKSSLPIGGVDGTLADRFTQPPLKGHVFAKTGTLGETRALAGYLDCASGQTVIFSILVGNHLPTSHADRDAMDKIVAAIAAAE